MRHAAYTLRIFVLLVVLSAFSGLSAASADVRVTDSHAGGLSLTYRADGLTVDSLTVGSKSYIRFFCGNHSLSGLPGSPALPARTVLFAAPAGSRPSLDITVHSRKIMTGVTVAPRPGLNDDDSGFSREEYREDPVRYALSGFQPATFVEVGQGHERGGLMLWELRFSPVLFDAHASTASIADSITVSLAWSGGIDHSESPSLIPEDVLNRAQAVSDTPVRARIAAGSASPFSTGEWYKISLSDSGMYAVSGVDLANNGFPVGSARVGEIRVYYGGGKVLSTAPWKVVPNTFREIAVKILDVNKDGYFGQEDSFLFYGESLNRIIPSPDTTTVTFQNHPYSRTNVYWLTRSSEGTPLRMQSFSETPAPGLPARTTFREFRHLERENTLEYVDSGIHWFWAPPIKSTSANSFTFNAPGGVAGDSVRVRVFFRNPTVRKLNMWIAPIHDLEVYVNNAGPFSLYIPALATSLLEFSLPAALPETDNLLNIRRISRSSSDLNDSVLLDWFEIAYDRKLAYTANGMEFYLAGNGAPEQLVLANVSRSTLELYDTTDPYRVAEYSGMVYDPTGRTLSFRAELPRNRYSRFIVVEPGNYRKPLSITRKTRSDLRNPGNSADYLVISHKNFLSEAKRLAEWRSRDSSLDPLRALAVDAADVYDEFAWGVFDPTAIRDYLKFLHETGQPQLRYCCLMGDATYKYKNINANQVSKNWIPTHTRSTITTDDFYTWFDTSNRPFISIGRLCVNTVEEAKTLVTKIIDYERNPESGLWHNRMLLIADDDTGSDGKGLEPQFTWDIENFDKTNYVPLSMERMKLLGIEYPLVNLLKPDATEAILSAFNEGAALSMYIGHGNKDLLAHEHILVASRDIERFTNAGRQSVFFIASCSTGKFDMIDYTTLAEMLHLRNGGGCIAVIAAARETYNSSNVDLAEQFYLNLFNTKINPEHRIGLALRNAKRVFADPVFDDNINELYIIFGDPALRLAVPRYTITASAPDSLLRLQKVDIPGSVRNGDQAIPFSGTMHVTARGPVQNKMFVTHANKYIYYTVPGKPFFRGEIPIGGTAFNASLVVPKDVISETKDSRIYLFAESGGNEAAGFIDKLSIGDIDPNAPDDVTGPEIKISFDGKVFDDGDYVKRQPTLSAVITDPSGVNIYGNRGHNVAVSIDNAEVFVLTDRVVFSGNHATATVEYALPQLTPGEHTLVFNAYDTYNNGTKKEVKLNVVGNETGDVAIRDLLNYPNPMRTEGTTFTFSLTDDAGSADIKIFSQSGRLVDTVRFSAGYGFNRVFWKPASEIANGVYFYKLTVRSLNGRTSTKTEKLIVMR